MQLSIAPKVMAQKQAPMQPAWETESAVSPAEAKGNALPLYALAVVVRIGVLGAILFHAVTLWPW